MADARRRDLERAALADPSDVEAHARLLGDRLRRGAIEPWRVEAARWLGDPRAVLLGRRRTRGPGKRQGIEAARWLLGGDRELTGFPKIQPLEVERRARRAVAVAAWAELLEGHPSPIRPACVMAVELCALSAPGKRGRPDREPAELLWLENLELQPDDPLLPCLATAVGLVRPEPSNRLSRGAGWLRPVDLAHDVVGYLTAGGVEAHGRRVARRLLEDRRPDRCSTMVAVRDAVPLIRRWERAVWSDDDPALDFPPGIGELCGTCLGHRQAAQGPSWAVQWIDCPACDGRGRLA